MAEKYERINENRIFIASFLDGILVHPLDRRTCEIYAFIKAGLYKKFGPRDRKLRRKTRIN
jgi:tRNA(fMet)-specific endonuclease VapC